MLRFLERTHVSDEIGVPRPQAAAGRCRHSEELESQLLPEAGTEELLLQGRRHRPGSEQHVKIGPAVEYKAPLRTFPFRNSPINCMRTAKELQVIPSSIRPFN